MTTLIVFDISCQPHQTAWVRRFGYHYLFFYLLLVLFAYGAAAHVDTLSVGPDPGKRPSLVYLPLIILIVLGIFAACLPAVLEAGDALEEGAVWAITTLGIACFITVNLLAWSQSSLLLCFIPIYVAGWVECFGGSWEQCGSCSVPVSFCQLDED